MALKFNLPVKASTESVDLHPGEVDGNWVSAGARKSITSDVIMGIASSIANYLKSKGKSKEEIEGQVVEFLNLCLRNNDIDDYGKKYFIDQKDWSEIETNIYVDEYSSTSWCAFYKIFDAARSAISCTGRWDNDYQKKMNAREQELAKALEEAQNAYYSARRAWREYVSDNAIIIINELVTKYAETLRKIDGEWFDEIEKEIKKEVAAVEKRRREKKAEDSDTISRPEPAA